MQNPLRLKSIHHVEFWVGNARQAAYYYSKAFGFHIAAYAGPETKVRDRASYMVEQNDARYVFTGAMGPESPIAQHAHEQVELPERSNQIQQSKTGGRAAQQVTAAKGQEGYQDISASEPQHQPHRNRSLARQIRCPF